jgi:hypothetical protein
MAALSVKVFLAVNLPTEVVKVAPSSFFTDVRSRKARATLK